MLPAVAICLSCHNSRLPTRTRRS
ncbi:hypothetical protein E2C01_082057 [Portunus trituberculatus]|uniref:Uncharacterized protein n=1 Tax=Portunus trituberculatus TaxID=210409 RepID=A0A5B7INZ0_PORTR|nr:hypothetical protein [Portunus trituberculatus]